MADGWFVPERSLHLLTLGPSDEPRWVRLVVHPIGDVWTAMLVGADEPLPDPDSLTGLCFFGRTPDEARGEALNYLGYTGSMN